MNLSDADLPGAWRDADLASRRGQAHMLQLTAAKIGGSLLSAVAGVCSWHIGRVDIAAWLILAGFVVAIFCELTTLKFNPERTWYEGRAVAESVKTLSWRYAVCADPFPQDMNRSAAEREFRRRLSSIIKEMSDQIIFEHTDSVITAGMSKLRTLSFPERRDAYIQGRTRDQQKWYCKKARTNQRRATVSWAILSLVESTAIIVAVGRILGLWSIDLAGLLAALISAGTAWTAVKQFSPLAAAYSVATKELGLQASRLASVNEDDWAVVAADAEEAISREHTTWLASRVGCTSDWNVT